MKTRYKIITVIGIFALFYLQLPLMLQQCNGNDIDCSFLTNLMNWTRMGIFSGDLEWSGTVQEKQQNHTV